MTTSTGTGTTVERAWSTEVAAFAAEHGVEQLLSPLLEMTKRLFPTVDKVEVRVEEDAELADFRAIVFAVRTTGLSVPQAVEVENRWCEEMLQLYPYPRTCPFVLDLDWTE